MQKADLESNRIPCLICEKLIRTGSPDDQIIEIEHLNFDQGVECRTHGNYGSQMWDNSGAIYFVLCDACLVKHSHKMVVDCKYEDSPMNGRDYYDKWHRGLKERRPPTDSYRQIVDPYFEDSNA